MGTFWNKLSSKFKDKGGSVWNLIKTSISKWWALDPFRQSAIIAYYAIFSLPALLVIIVSIAGLAFGADAVNSKIIEQISGTMGADTAEQIKEMLAKASETKTSTWATIIGIVTVILGSMGVFIELQKTLNMIWEVEEKPKKGVWGFLRTRVFSFGLILSIAFMLMVSLVLSTVLAAASDFLKADSSKFLALLFEGINVIISVSVISFLFALMFKFLPDTKIKWKHVWVGALVTGVLFTIGKTALAFYFGKADPGSGYGAAGSIILILLWVSYSSMILFLGAEFTHTYADMKEGRSLEKPDETAKAEKEESEEPESEERKPFNYSLLRFIPIVLPLVAIVNYVLPFLIPMVVKKVAQKSGVSINIKCISIGLFKSSFVIKSLSLRYGNSEDMAMMAFASIEEISIDYNRSAFFKKHIDIHSVIIRQPNIQITQGKINEAPKENQKPTSTPDSEAFPLILRRLSIEAGLAGFKNPNTHPLTEASIDFFDIFLICQGDAYIELSRYILEVDARLLGGNLKAKANLQPDMKNPSFKLQLQLLAVDLSRLNSFFKAYGKVDVHGGHLDVVAEASLSQNRIKGYVKPLIKDLEMLGPEDATKDISSKIKEGLIGFVKEALENQKHDQVATEIPFEGSLNKPRVNIVYAIGAVAVNIFIQALRPHFNPVLKDVKQGWLTVIE